MEEIMNNLSEILKKADEEYIIWEWINWLEEVGLIETSSIVFDMYETFLMEEIRLEQRGP